MKLAPPCAQVGAADVHDVLAGTSHCVSQTSSLSVSGATGAAVLRFATFIVTRRHAAPAGWHDAAAGQLTLDERMSRFGMFALVWPSASYVPSPAASLVEPSVLAWPVTLFFAYSPGPPI